MIFNLSASELQKLAGDSDAHFLAFVASKLGADPPQHIIPELRALVKEEWALEQLLSQHRDQFQEQKKLAVAAEKKLKDLLCPGESMDQLLAKREKLEISLTPAVISVDAKKKMESEISKITEMYNSLKNTNPDPTSIEAPMKAHLESITVESCQENLKASREAELKALQDKIAATMPVQFVEAIFPAGAASAATPDHRAKTRGKKRTHQTTTAAAVPTLSETDLRESKDKFLNSMDAEVFKLGHEHVDRVDCFCGTCSLARDDVKRTTDHPKCPKYRVACAYMDIFGVVADPFVWEASTSRLFCRGPLLFGIYTQKITKSYKKSWEKAKAAEVFTKTWGCEDMLEKGNKVYEFAILTPADPEALGVSHAFFVPREILDQNRELLLQVFADWTLHDDVPVYYRERTDKSICEILFGKKYGITTNPSDFVMGHVFNKVTGCMEDRKFYHSIYFDDETAKARRDRSSQKRKRARLSNASNSGSSSDDEETSDDDDEENADEVAAMEKALEEDDAVAAAEEKEQDEEKEDANEEDDAIDDVEN